MQARLKFLACIGGDLMARIRLCQGTPGMTSLFPSVASITVDNAQSNTRWMSTVPRIKPFKEWLCQMGSWVQRDPSFYKMISIVSALNSSVTDNIYVIQGFNGKFVFANDVDSAVMNLESSGCGGVNRLGPINFTCDGWYLPLDVDSEELPDLVDVDSASEAEVVVPEIQHSCDVFKGYTDNPHDSLELWKNHECELSRCGNTEAKEDNTRCQVTSSLIRPQAPPWTPMARGGPGGLFWISKLWVRNVSAWQKVAEGKGETEKVKISTKEGRTMV
ncbi:hypothetical protein C8R44DRAFT_723806 [Mycena epipterygia]|nr:hypothetical protein C8R44DRAFT_723806 [Mycena epipterygia]